MDKSAMMMALKNRKIKNNPKAMYEGDDSEMGGDLQDETSSNDEQVNRMGLAPMVKDVGEDNAMDPNNEEIGMDAGPEDQDELMEQQGVQGLQDKMSADKDDEMAMLQKIFGDEEMRGAPVGGKSGIMQKAAALARAKMGIKS